MSSNQYGENYDQYDEYGKQFNPINSSSFRKKLTRKQLRIIHKLFSSKYLQGCAADPDVDSCPETVRVSPIMELKLSSIRT